MAVAVTDPRPPVAPLDDAPKAPPTFAELYRRARAGTADAIEWAFLEAKARGRLAVAERQHKRIEEEDRDVRYLAGRHDTEAARSMAMQAAPDPIRWHKAEQAIADATAEAHACARMVELTKARPPAAPAPSALRGLSPAPVNQGRKP